MIIYLQNVFLMLNIFRKEKDFFDVTLACEGEQLEAHKVILSACSPFFRGVLRRNPHAHPLLYLKGVKYADLLAVLNFMYHGEVNVAQKDLSSFLNTAEELEVKGLTQEGEGAAGGGQAAKKKRQAEDKPDAGGEQQKLAKAAKVSQPQSESVHNTHHSSSSSSSRATVKQEVAVETVELDCDQDTSVQAYEVCARPTGH